MQRLEQDIFDPGGLPSEDSSSGDDLNTRILPAFSRDSFENSSSRVSDGIIAGPGTKVLIGRGLNNDAGTSELPGFLETRLGFEPVDGVCPPGFFLSIFADVKPERWAYGTLRSMSNNQELCYPDFEE